MLTAMLILLVPFNSGYNVGDVGQILQAQASVDPMPAGERDRGFTEAPIPPPAPAASVEASVEIAKLRAANNTTVSPSCGDEAPECLPEADVTARWPIAPGTYNAVDCCSVHTKLRDAAFRLFDFLEKLGIIYWLEGGTLLGNVRHGGRIIPWDDDIDIAVYLGSNSPLTKENFMKVLMSFNQGSRLRAPRSVMGDKEYHMEACFRPAHDRPGTILAGMGGWCSTAFKFHEGPRLGPNEDVWTLGPQIIDVFPFVLEDSFGFPSMVNRATSQANASKELLDLKKTPRLRLFSAFAGWDTERLKFPPSMVLPVVPCSHTFYGRAVPCPNDAIGYLKHTYGPSVLDSAVINDNYWALAKKETMGVGLEWHPPL